MIRALMWKEYREHRAIWLTMALVGGAGLYGLSQLMGPVWGMNFQSVHESLQSVAVLFAWAYGLICGAMLLANEQESGTLTFLDMLPVRRVDLWLVKSLFGLVLLLAQVAVLMSVVAGLGIADSRGQFLATLLAMLFFGVFALSWSLLFSANGDNVLNVIGLAFVGQIAASVVMSILLFPVAVVLLLVLGGNGELPKFVCLCLGILGLTAGPIFGSARLFTRLDRQRRDLLQLRARPQESLPFWTSWGRLLWLSYTQMRRLLLGMMIFSLVLGFLLLGLGPAGWPALTLLIGVLCGVTVWSDEQLSAAFRFLGDQRFPLGRVWIVKIGTRFGLAVLAALVLLLPSLILALIHRTDAQSPDERVPFFADLLHSSLVGPIAPVGIQLSLWLLYGFTVGQLCGLLVRKSLVAGVLALGMAGLLVSLWLPSLVGIGLHFWQVAGVPLILLAAGWLLMPAWAADRLLGRDTFVRLGSALLAAGLWIAGALWYRVAEIPDIPDQFDMPAYVASIPSFDDDKASQEIRSAWTQVDQLSRELHEPRNGEPLFPDLRQADNLATFSREIDAALIRGWPKSRSALGDWLNDQFKKEWYEELADAANHPLGVIENLKQRTFGDRLHVGGAYPADPHRLLVVRGLQLQAGGNHRAFVDNLRISLALARHLQHHAPRKLVHFGRRGERIGIDAALDRWLEKLPHDSELLERVRDILLEHEAQRPNDTDALKAAYLVARNSLDSVPESFVELQVQVSGGFRVGFAEVRNAELNAASLLWRIPWERQRHERILRLGFQGDPEQHRQARKWGGYALSNRDIPAPRGKRGIALLHAAQLKIAVRLYQARNKGRLPKTASDLVPRYLPNLPLDPFDGQPLRYRISKVKETLDWFGDASIPWPLARADVAAPPPRPVQTVTPGQALLWSVGEDGHDDGGTQQGRNTHATSFGQDLIYLAPLSR